MCNIDYNLIIVMKNIVVSIIVPIYNIEAYLPQCLESIINQTYKNLDIILINDGSTDKSKVICVQYASDDDRIRVIHKDNGGLSTARNAGLDIAHGEWVSFIDGDDWMEPDMIEVLLEAAYKTNSEISCCNIKLIQDNKFSIEVNNTNQLKIYDKISAFRQILKGELRFEVWNKLFKKDIIANTRFIVGQTYEDVYFDRIVFSKVTKVSYIDKALYCYRVSRPGSTCSSFKESRFVIFNEIEQISIYLNNLNQKKISAQYIKYGAETAISFYVDALRLNCGKETISIIQQYFNTFYYQLKIRSVKIFLFKISPWMYLILRKYL